MQFALLHGGFAHRLCQRFAPLAALQEHVCKHDFRARFAHAAHHRLDLGGGVAGKAVHGHDDRLSVDVFHVLDVFIQVGHARLQRGQVFFRKGSLVRPAVQFERLDGGDDDDAVGLDARHAALGIEEFFSPQVGAEARLRDHPVCQRQRRIGGDDAVAAVGDVGERPAVHDGGGALQRLHEVGLDGVLQQRAHGALRVQVARVHVFAFAVFAHDDIAQAPLQVLEGRCQAQDRHHLAGGGDLEVLFALGALPLLPDGDVAEGSVVHVEAAAEIHLGGVDIQRVAAEDVVIEHGAQQVVRRRDGVQVARKVQVDLFHGHHLRVTAARSTPLDAEHGAERGFAQRQAHLFAQARHAVCQADGYRRLPLARGGGIDGGDQNELTLPRPRADWQLGLVLAVALQLLFADAQLCRHRADILHLTAVRDLDIR